MDTGGSLRQVRLGNVEAAHKNKIIAMGRTTSSLNTEIMARLRPLIGSGHDAIFMVNASLIAKPPLSAGLSSSGFQGGFLRRFFSLHRQTAPPGSTAIAGPMTATANLEDHPLPPAKYGTPVGTVSSRRLVIEVLWPDPAIAPTEMRSPARRPIP
jgi:hypothetical protein